MGLLRYVPMPAGLKTKLQDYRNRLRRFVRMNLIKTRFGIESIRNWYIDRQFGGFCGGTFASRFEDTGAWGTSSVDYCQMPRLFSAAHSTAIKPSDVLVDVGCGRGRVINWWLRLGLGNSIYGIELDPQFAHETAQRLAGYPNVQIIQGNVLENLPQNATLFFLFNPFKPPVLETFKNRLIDVYGENSSIRIVYYMSIYKQIFEADDRWVVEPIHGNTFWPAALIRMRGSSRNSTVAQVNSTSAGALAGSERE